VIALAGAETRDESLRRFAAALVERPGAPVVVWSEEDVRVLVGESGAASAP
jgi:hypothetical protein